ncbi:MAG: hypothetical protein ABFS43_10525 [Thermodesulfobacteriota bacterium]
MRYITPLLIIVAVMFSLVISTNGLAATVGVEATTLKQLSTGKPPLDVETSTDGKLMFVLVPGEVLIYSNLGDHPINRIPVNPHFNRMTFAEKLDLLILSSNSNKKVDMVRIDLISDISTEGSPYKGKADAAVTIAVFDDYQ